MKDIFCKIRDREIEKEFVYEDDEIMVFPDIRPIKPVHLLVVPKKHIKDFGELSDDSILTKMKSVIHKLIKEHNLETKGYRIGINGGGAQIVDHLHLHLMSPWGQHE